MEIYQALKAVAEVLGTTTDYLNGSNDLVHPYPDVSSIPIDDDKPYSYRGYHVPDKYLEIVKSLMDYDIGKGVADDVKD
ncbi:hypothetical protein FC52_GL001609 [Lactobacillus pasteurii DSM 23907 = CRBIP 24.76]|uniref:Putative transcriptional regulator n=1 Tax=Lactobacillus pasteurii DSM 23907 = CRBIP 24.76 TaxID=1423790 RepID=I7IYU7_9LACO|nr:hypothetical protein FC52_GL001609 [Lactobacillus pasteurii DSM 23907 = CRBIP 24.76]TDG77728.1 hypothetical protein C5L33_000139 [Lactobacillus pasteurii]CCI84727.1 Putative transcriptional regulator [Lactobacillus pasteurii DSM 23907 = CRBIP 24.76]